MVYRDDEKENGNHCIVYCGYIGMMEKKMETTMPWPFQES